MRKKVTNEQFEEAYGTTDKLTKTQQDNRNIMRTVTSRYSALIPAEELHTCALQALWRCLSYHDDTKGQKFTTSLWRFTDWECKRELRRKHTKKNINTVSVFDFDIEEESESPTAESVRECVALLPAQHKELINQYYFENRTMEEIGRLHNYSKEAARQKIGKAVRRLQEIYGVS